MEKYKNRKWTLALVLCVAVLVLSLCAGMFAYAADETGATVKEVSIVATDGYEFDGTYWRDTSPQQYYAFTQTMSQKDALARIAGVKVVYDDGTAETIALTTDNYTWTNGTGDNSNDNHAALLHVMATTPNKGVEIDQDLTLNFKKLENYALVISGYDPSGLNLTSGMNIGRDFKSIFEQPLSGHIFIMRTDGSQLTAVSSEYVEADGALTPTAEYLKSLAAGNAETTYQKSLGVKLTSEGIAELSKEGYSQISSLRSATIDNITVTYEPPKSITGISQNSSISRQLARSEFDFSDFDISFRYSGTPIRVSAKDFAAYITVSYYDDDGTLLGTGKDYLTTKATNARFSVALPISNENAKLTYESGEDNWYGISVEQSFIQVPTLSDAELPYADGGVSVTLNNIPKLDGDGNNITVTLDKGTLTGDNTSGYTAKFDKGGIYTLTVTLNENGDYKWADPSGVEGLNRTLYVLTYTITVSGAPVTLDFSHDATEEYGDAPSYSFQATVEGSPSMNFASGHSNRVLTPGDPFKQNATSMEEKPNFRLVYSVVNNNGELNGNKYETPTAVGTYKVYLETAETAWYQGATSDPVEFEITKRTIPVGAVKTEAEFTNNEFKASDIISLDETSGRDLTAYGEDVDQIISLTVDGGNKILRAGKYGVTLTLTDGLGANYILSNGKTSLETSFTVKAAVLSFTVTAATNEFEYSGNVASQISSAITLGTDNLKGFVEFDKDNVKYYAATDTSYANALNASESNKWVVGEYIAIYPTKDIAKSTGAQAPDDYNLPFANFEFKVVQKAVTKVTLTKDSATYGGQWNTSYNSQDPNYLWQYGTNLVSTLNNLLTGDANKAPDGAKILTVAVAGTRLSSTTSITTGITIDEAARTITLNQAGEYVVTITLNPNYKWDDGTENNTINYYGAISKANVWGLGFSDTDNETVYNGTDQTVKAQFDLSGVTGKSWHTQFNLTNAETVGDVLNITSIVGADFAAADLKFADFTVNNGAFDVKNAGTYTVTFEIADKDNYQWSDYTGDMRELTYTVNQAPLTGNWGGDTKSYPYQEGAEYQTTPTFTLDLFADDASKISFTTTLYSDAAYSNAVSGNKITTAGTFYIAVTNRYAAETAPTGDTTYLNYYLPTEGEELAVIRCEFVITPSGLDVITLTNGDDKRFVISTTVNTNDTITFTYFGTAKKFSDFISTDGKTAYINGSKYYIDISVDGATENDKLMRDVKMNGTSVDKYVITVKPAANYKWKTGENGATDEQQPFTFYIVINQLAVNLGWSGTSMTYGDVQAQAVATVNNKAAADDVVDVTVQYKSASGSVITIDNATPAQKYSVEAISLSNSNYTLTGGENLTVNYYVYKKGIDKPQYNGNASGMYNGSAQTTAKLYANSNALWTQLKATVAGKYPASWFVDDADKQDRAFADSTGIAFNVTNGTLTFTNAGAYTVTFAIIDSANYCWADDLTAEQGNFGEKSYSYSWNEIEIQRAIKDSPILGNLRAMEQLKDEASTMFTEKFASLSNITVKFGTRGSDTVSDSRNDLESDGTRRRGFYYVLLTLDGDLAYNYTWNVPYDNDEKDGYLGSNYGNNGTNGSVFDTIWTNEKGAQLKLYYAITASQVGITFTINDGGYTFGANGAGYWNLLTRDFAENTAISHETWRTINSNIPEATIKTITYTFTKLAANPTNNEVLGADELVNGLPWNTGEYSVYIVIDFVDDKQYQQWTDTQTFTVSKLLAQVAWDGNASATYNGGEHTRGVTVTNVAVAERNADDNYTIPTLDTNKVINVNYKDGAVAPHTITIGSISDDNYTIEGLENNTADFTVNRKVIAVIGTDVPNHVYGDAIKAADKQLTVNGDGFVTGTWSDWVEVKLLTSLQGATDVEATYLTNVGTYRVVPRIKNAQGNYELTVTEGTYTVVKREITITINTDAGGKTRATSKYGDEPVNLNGSAYFTVGGKYLPSGVAASTVFTLFVTDINSKADVKPNINNKSIVGNYPIGVTLLDSANYSITNRNADNKLLDDGGAVVNYVITNADITNVTVTGYTGTYDAAAHPWFNSYDATRKNDETLVWYIQKRENNASIDKNGTWTPYTNQTITNAFDSASYYVKVTADNHNPAYYMVGNTEAAVDVTVNKATLYVAVNKNIFFGEDGLQARGASEGKWWQQSLTYLRSESSIFTVTGFVGADNGQADRAKFYSDGDFYDVAELGNNGFAYKYFDKKYTKGANVGEYKLQFVANGLTCGNYNFVSVADEQLGKLTVSKLPVTLTLKNYEALYNQENPVIPEIALSNLATTQTSSYDDGEIIAINDNTDVSKIVTLSHQALTNANSDITTNNADTYEITFTWGGNYNGTAAAQYTYTIKPTNNAISTEDYSLFMDAPSVNITKGETLSANAWIYGDYSSNHTDGYNSGNGGRHVLKEFAMLFGGEALTISLYREGVTEALKSVTADKDFYAAARDLFNEVWTKGGFVAGDYTVTFSMGESQNYVAFSESWGFRIGKQTLTITPANLAVIYGYGLGDATHDNVFGKNTGYYYYSDSGLVSNGGTRDTLENVITFVFGSEYAAGYEKGSVNANGYQIHVYTVGNENVTCKNDGTYSCETDNYTVEFAAAKVTVSAREITVRIATLSNFFNLLTMDSNFHYGKEDPSQYLFTITTGTLADGDINGPQDGKWSNDAQKVFSLSSQALTRPEGTTWETNNAKDYPIYLLAKSNYSKNGYSNYAINVTAENAYNGDITVPSTAIGNGAYGTFTIKPAKLNLYVNGPYIGNTDTLYSNSATESANAIVYDGKVKVFKPAYELPAYMAGTIPKTKIVYYSVVNGEETECDEIKDVGSYSIICQIEDPNYETGRSKTTHNIGKRVISVSELAITTESDAQVHPGNNGAYYFNGYNQTKPVNFERLVEGELIGLNCEVNSTNCTATVNGNSLTITARNAGNYTVTITLQDNGNFKASNYALDDIGGATKQFGLNILKAGLTVNVEKANIQYGTPLGANNNLPEQGFTLTYEMYYGTSNEGKDVLNTILGKEKDAGLFSEANVSYKLDYMVTSVVDSAFKVQPQNLRADNFVINYGTEGMLTVVQRQLTVKIYGYNDKADETHATSKYLGLNKDPLSEGWTLGDYVDLIEGNLVNDHGLDTLKITLSVKSKRNANNDMDVYFADSTPYDIIVGRASDTNANYAVKFVNAQGNEIDNDAPETMPKFNITKATVTVSPKDQTVIYGNALNATLLSVTAVTWNNVRELVEFNGFVNGETYDGIVSQKALDLDNRFKFGNDYTPYGSHVGNDVKLWMDEDATSLLFTNYEVEFDQSEITVTPRPITVATENQIYREAKDSDDNIIYNGGASGDRHVAPVLFAGHNGGVGYSDDYLPVVVDSYSTNATPSVPVSGAPTTVGNYFVTFTLKNNGTANCYDYVFANDLQGRESDTVAKLTYNVTPKYVNPYWEQGGMTLSGASATNKLPNYVEALMNVKEFTLTIGTNRSDVTDYVKSNDGLDVTVSADGIYTVTLTWLDSAKNNYRWTDDVAEISCVFYVSSNKVTINSVTIENWTYGESMSAIVASVTGGNESNLRYTYAYYGKDITVTIPASEYGGLSYNATPINAGLYVLKAEYPSTSTLAGDTYYTTFIIHKAKVQAPELKTEATFVFNGSEQSVEITFNKARMALSNYDVVRYETTNDGITVYATNAKVYTVTFNLLDEDNYTFANSTDNLVSWTIDRYGKTTVIIDEISKVTYGSALVINANETFLGELRYYYLTSDETPSENADWSTDRPINVGTHWVKAVSEGNGNYDGNFAIASYEIVPARLVVTPTGSMTYGDNIDEAKATFKYDITGGLVANDSKSVLKTIDGIDVEFAVEGNPSKYNATNYVLKLVETDGAVKGLVAENYIVVSGAGTLRVDKKALTLTIGYASSEYGAEIDLSNVNMSFSEDPVEGDNLDITLSTDAMPNGVTPKPVGGYRITASYNNGNYDIRIVTGTYSITQRRISIAFEDGIGGVYQNVKPVTLDNCPITVLAGDIADIREYCANAGIDIALVVTYNGVANDGTNVNSTTAPQFAGTYVANIKCNNANFTVVGDAFAQFTIAKKSVDAGKLVIENAAYTNSNIKPVVTVPTDAAAQEMFYYSDNGQTKLVFTQDEQVFKTVGSHTFCLTLVDPDNYQWVSVTTAEREMTFRIVKAQNSLVVEGGENKPIIIADWTFGQTANAPTATIKYGDSANIVFEYSTSENGGYTYNVPTNAGTYYVRATMAADDNYEAFTSAPVQFTINKAPLTAPSLTLVAEGEGQNNVYTGKRLLSTVVGYDSLLMRPFYDAEKVTVNAIGNSVTVVATNAGEYTVTFQLADADNYCWASGVSEVVLNWTIARQKVELPTANNNTYIVNGKDLVYTPNGFDSSIMNIEGNVTAYGGNFTATVTLKDTANYEWADDPNRVDVKFTWSVIGINVVFIIIICVVSGACVALAIMAAVQAIRHRGKKRAEARAIDKRSKADGWTGKEPQAEAETAAEAEQNQTETDSNEGGNE